MYQGPRTRTNLRTGAQGPVTQELVAAGTALHAVYRFLISVFSLGYEMSPLLSRLVVYPAAQSFFLDHQPLNADAANEHYYRARLGQSPIKDLNHACQRYLSFAFVHFFGPKGSTMSSSAAVLHCFWMRCTGFGDIWILQDLQIFSLG